MGGMVVTNVATSHDPIVFIFLSWVFLSVVRGLEGKGKDHY